MMKNVQIKRYDALSYDKINRLHELYNNSFDLMKMTKDNFVKRLFWNDISKIYFLAETENNIIGYLIVVRNSILLIIVDGAYRNKGIGTDLLRRGGQEIKTKYDKINLTAPDYFLCGVPFDTKSSYYKWFENRGFIHDWTSFDMVVDLVNFAYRAEDFPCAIDGVIIKKLGNNSNEIMSCRNGADRVENGWGEYFLGGNVEAIIAVKDKEVIGGVLVPSLFLFDGTLKETGSFGVLWVLDEYRNKGLGMKLYANSLFELKNRGYKTCHIGYTYLDAWYGKLGAEKYIEYWIGGKNL
jgi:predicted N-acetyltransferase YhbS